MAKDHDATIGGKDVRVEYDKDIFANDGGPISFGHFRTVDITNKETGESVRGSGNNREEAERNAVDDFKNK